MTLKYDQLADALAKLKFPEQGSDPTPYANDGYLYAKDVGGVTELHYMDDSGDIARLTDDGYIGPNHRFVTLRTQVGDPSADPPKGFLYTKLGLDGEIELFFLNGSGNVVQITTGGSLNSTFALIRLPERSIDAETVPDIGAIYTKQSEGITELFFVDSGGKVSKLTRDGYLADGYAHDDSFDASGGETNMSLTAAPRFAINKVSGRELDVYRNGLLLKWAATPVVNSQWKYNAGAQRVEFGGSLDVTDWIRAVYKSYS
jgi:hypothetical protein